MSLSESARRYFGLTLPVTRDALKSAYRKAARRLHSDVGGSDELFIPMQAAYDALTSPYVAGVFTDSPQLLKTEEGTSLNELGLGLGPLKNGRECVTCKGAGYSMRLTHVWSGAEPCIICRCAGTTLGCRNRCSGRVVEHLVYRVCAPCLGRGETEIFNPVISKGFLSSGNLGQKARKRAEAKCN